MDAWLRRLRHDLVKPLVWPARDLVELGRPLRETDLQELTMALTLLIDETGAPVILTALWQQLRSVAPAAVPVRALDRFTQALEKARAACSSDVNTAVEALLALEPAFVDLAQSVHRDEP